jgi:hypothetical protein
MANKSPYMYVQDAIDLIHRKDINKEAKWNNLSLLLLKCREAFVRESKKTTVADMLFMLFLFMTSVIGCLAIIVFVCIRLGYVTPCGI